MSEIGSLLASIAYDRTVRKVEGWRLATISHASLRSLADSLAEANAHIDRLAKLETWYSNELTKLRGPSPEPSPAPELLTFANAVQAAANFDVRDSERRLLLDRAADFLRTRTEADAAVARELARFARREREAEARAVEAETKLEAATTRLASLTTCTCGRPKYSRCDVCEAR